MARATWNNVTLADSDKFILDGQTNPDAAWSYLEPKPKARNITGYVAFWKGIRVET
jgi:uncharacterized protein (DUF427 family)